MPLIELTTLTDLQDARAVINDMWAYLRTRIPDFGSRNLTLADVQRMRGQGYRAFGYRRASAANRLDGAVVWNVEQIIHPPDLTPQPWVVIPYLVVRVSVLPTQADREKAMILALKLLIQEAVNIGAVGIMATYDMRWADLHNFIATWPMVEIGQEPDLSDPTKGIERIWARLSTTAPEFATRTAGITPE